MIYLLDKKSIIKRINGLKVKEVNDKNTQFHIEFKGQLNPMMEIMVKTPLQTFINDLSKNIANLN